MHFRCSQRWILTGRVHVPYGDKAHARPETGVRSRLNTPHRREPSTLAAAQMSYRTARSTMAHAMLVRMP